VWLILEVFAGRESYVCWAANRAAPFLGPLAGGVLSLAGPGLCSRTAVCVPTKQRNTVCGKSTCVPCAPSPISKSCFNSHLPASCIHWHTRTTRQPRGAHFLEGQALRKTVSPAGSQSTRSQRQIERCRTVEVIMILSRPSPTSTCRRSQSHRNSH
jgi:hypothetical protein